MELLPFGTLLSFVIYFSKLSVPFTDGFSRTKLNLGRLMAEEPTLLLSLALFDLR